MSVVLPVKVFVKGRPIGEKVCSENWQSGKRFGALKALILLPVQPDEHVAMEGQRSPDQLDRQVHVPLRQVLHRAGLPQQAARKLQILIF